ncbi:uncharacterized protein LOC133204962 [Saccostrea echinata]|uniref:uncharacterized protein LOC133204962 n=1 Tax=Saccostrea echinata TaxID=191078 RepID=UPI002A82AA04|nr:uncharacterized protein LOC133204962 [Saccostrea echinata]
MSSSICDKPPPPPGGQKVVNVTDPRVIKASFVGIESINLQNGFGEDVLREVIYKITNATEQVVNGELFRLIMEVGPSECFNTLMNIGKNAAECPLLSPKLVHPCFTEVLSRNWTVPQHLTLNISCQPLPNIESAGLHKIV